MGYVGLVIEGLVFVFVWYSVMKTIKENKEKGIRRVCDAFVWMGVFGFVIAMVEFCAFLGWVSRGFNLSNLDVASMWSFAYIAAWLLDLGIRKEKKTESKQS